LVQEGFAAGYAEVRHDEHLVAAVLHTLAAAEVDRIVETVVPETAAGYRASLR
jgi:Tfp pilus assembly pilus retraction ATPase PilT